MQRNKTAGNKTELADEKQVMRTKPCSVKVACLKNKIRIFYALALGKDNIRRPKNAIAVNSLIIRILHILFFMHMSVRIRDRFHAHPPRKSKTTLF